MEMCSVQEFQFIPSAIWNQMLSKGGSCQSGYIPINLLRCYSKVQIPKYQMDNANLESIWFQVVASQDIHCHFYQQITRENIECMWITIKRSLLLPHLILCYCFMSYIFFFFFMSQNNFLVRDKRPFFLYFIFEK